MEVKPERIAQIIRKVDGNHKMGAGALADAIIQELEKDRPLSDLEIVQKALFVTGTTLIMTDGEWQIKAFNESVTDVVAGGSMQSLLTWAKQTIEGVE